MAVSGGVSSISDKIEKVQANRTDFLLKQQKIWKKKYCTVICV